MAFKSARFLFDTRGGAHQTSGQERRILDVCRPMRFVRFLCVYASLQKREKKKRESSVACGSRDARKTHRTREKLRDVSDASIPSRFRAVCAHLTPVASRIARVIDTTSSGGVAILQEMRNESLKTTYLTRSFLSLQTRSLRVRRKCKEA